MASVTPSAAQLASAAAEVLRAHPEYGSKRAGEAVEAAQPAWLVPHDSAKLRKAVRVAKAALGLGEGNNTGGGGVGGGGSTQAAAKPGKGGKGGTKKSVGKSVKVSSTSGASGGGGAGSGGGGEGAGGFARAQKERTFVAALTSGDEAEALRLLADEGPLVGLKGEVRNNTHADALGGGKGGGGYRGGGGAYDPTMEASGYPMQGYPQVPCTPPRAATRCPTKAW